MYKIERKEILSNNVHRFQRKYPLAEMQPGDTFDFPASKISSVRNSIYYFQVSTDKEAKFKVFRVDPTTARCACIIRGGEVVPVPAPLAPVFKALDGKHYEVDSEGCIFNEDGEEINERGDVVDMASAELLAERKERKERFYG